MAWEIMVFETSSGDKPVEKFIKSLQPQTISKVSHGIDLLEKYGNQVGMPHSKKIEGDIYELRIRGKQEVRILYIFLGDIIYLLHGFRKQTQKTSRKEIEIALERSKQVRQTVK